MKLQCKQQAGIRGTVTLTPVPNSKNRLSEKQEKLGRGFLVGQNSQAAILIHKMPCSKSLFQYFLF